VLYRSPATVDPFDATLWNSLAGGVQWAVLNTSFRPGSSVAVLGCGQRGLACLLALRSASAGLVLVSGLTRDRHKLSLATELGADVTVDVERQDVRAAAERATSGRGSIMSSTQRQTP
jgi:threonine dehydrogenase-like Zn-dependent dehydrogenase